jgi:hypothetical protein
MNELPIVDLRLPICRKESAIGNRKIGNDCPLPAVFDGYKAATRILDRCPPALMTRIRFEPERILKSAAEPATFSFFCDGELTFAATITPLISTCMSLDSRLPFIFNNPSL